MRTAVWGGTYFCPSMEHLIASLLARAPAKAELSSKSLGKLDPQTSQIHSSCCHSGAGYTPLNLMAQTFGCTLTPQRGESMFHDWKSLPCEERLPERRAEEGYGTKENGAARVLLRFASCLPGEHAVDLGRHGRGNLLQAGNALKEVRYRAARLDYARCLSFKTTKGDIPLLRLKSTPQNQIQGSRRRGGGQVNPACRATISHRAGGASAQSATRTNPVRPPISSVRACVETRIHPRHMREHL